MPGIINWTATFGISSPSPVQAQIYDKNGNVVITLPIPCAPPIDCPFPMENVGFGKYKAALASGGNRYYYIEGAAEVTVPNQAVTATVIEVSQQESQISVEINVQPQ